jgi:hypothetical protein
MLFVIGLAIGAAACWLANRDTNSHPVLPLSEIRRPVGDAHLLVQITTDGHVKVIGYDASNNIVGWAEGSHYFTPDDITTFWIDLRSFRSPVEQSR